MPACDEVIFFLLNNFAFAHDSLLQSAIRNPQSAVGSFLRDHFIKIEYQAGDSSVGRHLDSVQPSVRRLRADAEQARRRIRVFTEIFELGAQMVEQDSSLLLIGPARGRQAECETYSFA